MCSVTLSHHVEYPVRRMMIVSIMDATRAVQLRQVAAVRENVQETILNLADQQEVSAVSLRGDSHIVVSGVRCTF